MTFPDGTIKEGLFENNLFVDDKPYTPKSQMEYPEYEKPEAIDDVISDSSMITLS